MQLPDEAITYQYPSLLVPASEEWTTAAELRAQHLVPPAELRELTPRLLQVRSQVAAEREVREAPPELHSLQAGFIDLPQRYLDQYRRQEDRSLLGRILLQASRLRDDVDRVVVLGAGGPYLGARALFEALRSPYHNELPPDARLGAPRMYFEGNNFDNDALQDLLDLLQITCVEPDLRAERWGVLVVSKSGDTLETAAAYRVFRREAVEFYGSHWERLRQLLIPVTGETGRLREQCKADGYAEHEVFALPADVSGRYAVFTAAGLLPAAVLGLDVRALLLGAASMTRRFLEEPFERNPVLQYAGLNHLLTTRHNKPLRVLAVWSRKLEAVGHWYNHLLAESLGKQGQGPTPLTVVQTRDLHARGQQHQDGARDKVINNLVVRSSRTPPILLGMAERNQDELNRYSRKGYPDLLDAALRGSNEAYAGVARPTADLVLPMLSEHVLGQLLQMLMLATVVEGRLVGINPYGQPGVEVYKRNMKALLKA
jgi:glucose-6-phosphate isomerase